MIITYDRAVNAAYIYVVPRIDPGIVKITCPCDLQEIGAHVNLDFDVSGKLLGIEILDANLRLSKETLEMAKIIG